MLELEEVDLRSAAAHALAGADLLNALVDQGGTHPDWVAVHQEQFCRYGGIWIHRLIINEAEVPSGWVERGVELLDQLNKFHDQPLPWVASLQDELLPYHASHDVKQPLSAVIVGNCQTFPLFLGLKQLPTLSNIYCATPVHLASPSDVKHLHGWLAEADLLICHRVQPGYRNNIGLDTSTLRCLLSSSAQCIVLPSVHYEGLHPWIGYSHDPDGRLAEIETESPLGPYHDFLAMAAVAEDLNANELLRLPCSGALSELIIRHHHQSLDSLGQREKDCDLEISDWIAAHHQSQPLMHTINHPTQLVLDQLLRRLVACFEPARTLDPEVFDAHEHLGELTIPIHPWVRHALELQSWADRWGQRGGFLLPHEKQWYESILFYRSHPELVQINSAHPKMRWALQCLTTCSAAD